MLKFAFTTGSKAILVLNSGCTKASERRCTQLRREKASRHLLLSASAAGMLAAKAGQLFFQQLHQVNHRQLISVPLHIVQRAFPFAMNNIEQMWTIPQVPRRSFDRPSNAFPPNERSSSPTSSGVERKIPFEYNDCCQGHGKELSRNRLPCMCNLSSP